MQIITLYKYTRPDGGVTVSPNMPDGDYTTLYRLVADEGMELVNGEVRTACVDTDSTDGWTEEEAIEPQEDMRSEHQDADTDAMLVDHEYRLTLLELGLEV